MSERTLSEPIQEVIDLTRDIADVLDRRRREPSNISAAATIATWAFQNDVLLDVNESVQLLHEAFGGDFDVDDADDQCGPDTDVSAAVDDEPDPAVDSDEPSPAVVITSEAVS